MTLALDYSLSSDTTKNNGNLGTETITRAGYSTSWVQSFTYDGLNRISLASETSPTPGWSDTNSYDQFGNRWVSAHTGSSLDPYTPQNSTNYDGGNHLYIQTMKYDNDGNATQVGGYGFAYDAEGRLESSSINNSATNFIYDAAGRRVMRRTPTGDTTYLYDAGGMLMAEYPSVASPAPCTTCYLSQDHLGSTRLELDGSGTAIGCHDFKPFGEEIEAGVDGRTRTCWAATETTLKFTGKERDAETGLDYFGARDFSGAQGRFTSPDPIHIMPQKLVDPQQWNMYAYGRNNPLRFVDPTGMYVDDCANGDKACTKRIDKFEKARQKDLKSKNEAVRDAAAQYGNRGENNDVTVHVMSSQQMEQTLALNGQAANGAIVPVQGQGQDDDRVDIRAEQISKSRLVDHG